MYRERERERCTYISMTSMCCIVVIITINISSIIINMFVIVIISFILGIIIIVINSIGPIIYYVCYHALLSFISLLSGSRPLDDHGRSGRSSGSLGGVDNNIIC